MLFQPEFIRYEHHGTLVWVQTSKVGQHRDHCLCYSCEKFKFADKPGENCPISSDVYDLCVSKNLVLPVWECPEFVEMEPIDLSLKQSR